MGGSAKEGLVRVLLLFPPKLRTLESRRVELPGRGCGMAGTSVTASDCGEKKPNKPVMVTPACSAAPAETGFSLGGKSSCSLLLLLFFFFPVILKMALIYLPLLRCCPGVLCRFYSVPALSQRPGLHQVALVPMNSHFDMEFYRNVIKV